MRIGAALLFGSFWLVAMTFIAWITFQDWLIGRLEAEIRELKAARDRRPGKPEVRDIGDESEVAES